MKLRAAVLGVVVCLAAFGLQAAAAANVYDSASETYYRLDVPGGAISVHVVSRFRAGGQDLAKLPFWAMPAAKDVAVTQDGTALTTEVTALGDQEGIPTFVLATLPKPLRSNTETTLEMTYVVPAQQSELVHIEPGVIEGLFVSQGPGSFVYIDAPASGDNFFEPGCLLAKDQPSETKESGLQRWICGEVTIIALSGEDSSVQEKCANADDHCRQRFQGTPFSAFAQSVTDPSKQGILEGDVQLAKGPVKLTLKYFRSDQAWAQKQFAIAQEALPKLEAAFGFDYPHSTVLLRQSHFIELVGAAGVAFPSQGEMLISNTGEIDAEVTVHELAHQWAGANLQTSWLWEGLAEYGMRTLAPSMGITPRDWGWQRFGYTDPLASWWDGSAITNPYYWYGKAGAFWFAYQTAIGGPDNMHAVLGQMDDDPARLPLDGRWFMDVGERVSGAKLDDLFLTWVWNKDTAAGQLAERRAAHDLVDALTARETALGLSGQPTDLQANLDAWSFSPVAGQVQQANAVLDSLEAVNRLAADAGLPPTDAIAKVWNHTTIGGAAAAIEDQRQAVVAITNAAGQLADQAPGSAPLARLDDARAKYAAGAFDEAEHLAAASTTIVFNAAASTKMIELAKQTQTGYSASFFGRVGLLMADPDKDLADAQAAYAAGDYGKALTLSKSAYDTWDGADSRGLMRLAIAAGLMCGLSTGVWWGIRRLEPKRPSGRNAPQGHVLSDDRRGQWNDWENLGR